MVGMNVSDASASMKQYCPFGEIFHADGGRSKSFRIFSDSNSAYCYACSEYFDPVLLLARYKDLSKKDAALFLLDYINYRPEDAESRWASLLEDTVPVDQDYLSEALKVFCSGVSPEWEIRQFDRDVSDPFNRCLKLLPMVRTDEDACKWLSVSKQVMRNTLGVSNEFV